MDIEPLLTVVGYSTHNRAGDLVAVVEPAIPAGVIQQGPGGTGIGTVVEVQVAVIVSQAQEGGLGELGSFNAVNVSPDLAFMREERIEVPIGDALGLPSRGLIDAVLASVPDFGSYGDEPAGEQTLAVGDLDGTKEEAGFVKRWIEGEHALGAKDIGAAVVYHPVHQGFGRRGDLQLVQLGSGVRLVGLGEVEEPWVVGVSASKHITLKGPPQGGERLGLLDGLEDIPADNPCSACVCDQLDKRGGDHPVDGIGDAVQVDDGARSPGGFEVAGAVGDRSACHGRGGARDRSAYGRPGLEVVVTQVGVGGSCAVAHVVPEAGVYGAS